MACLDTTVLLDLAGRGGKRRREQARTKLSELVARGEPLCTTRINVAEMYVGVYRSHDAVGEEETLETILRELIVLEVDAVAARLFGRITAVLQEIGRPSGDFDVLIAAVALAWGQSLVTENVSHFAKIPELEVETY